MLIEAQVGGWAVGTFLPTYLKSVRGMTSVGTLSYLLVLILGTYMTELPDQRARRGAGLMLQLLQCWARHWRLVPGAGWHSRRPVGLG